MIRKKMEVNVEVERSRLENFNSDSLYMLCKKEETLILDNEKWKVSFLTGVPVRLV